MDTTSILDSKLMKMKFNSVILRSRKLCHTCTTNSESEQLTVFLWVLLLAFSSL